MGTLQEIEAGRLANRSKVQIQVGDYVLTLDPIWMMFNVAHRGGNPVPKALSGRYLRPEDFRQAAEKVHGSEYSLDGLKGRDRRLAEAAVRAGIDPSTLKLGEER